MKKFIALIAAGVLAAGGCAGSDSTTTSAPGGGAVPEKQKDAAAALASAATELQKDTYKTTVNLGDQGTMTGVADPKSKNAEFVMESTSAGAEGTTTLRVVDGVTYIKIALKESGGLPGFDGKKWRKLDSSGELGTLGNFDATQMTKSLESAAEVAWVDDDTVKGTIDLAESAKQLGVGTEVLGKLSSTKLPFQADIDSAGRLATYKFTMPAVGSQAAYDFDMKYSDFGTPVNLKAPAAKDIMAS
ncbi:hypothetical protein [Actinoplanes sichuanensis]|uniref:Lipoprotein LprG n=1 Tax=Actinoplanes sichuanensis TaxID=512349 RepID=A0ABW4ABF9_9ACTN|nr:hypothetical protein [Actinoplanes sichuanensis]